MINIYIENGKRPKLAATGTVREIAAEIGFVVHAIYNALPEGERAEFRGAVECLTSRKEGNPVWMANGAIKDDAVVVTAPGEDALKELLRAAREGKNNE